MTSPRSLAVFIAAFGLAGVGEWAAIRSGSSSLALATLAWYGAIFALLAWSRPSLAVPALVTALPLITVEVGLGNVERTLSADKVALVAVVGVWLARGRWMGHRRFTRSVAVRGWAVFLLIVALSALRNGLGMTEGWRLGEQLVYAGVFVMALDAFDGEPPVLRRTLTAAAWTAAAVASLAVWEWFAQVSGRGLPWLYFKHGTMMDVQVPGATIAHVNFLGGYLVLVVPLLLVLAWQSALVLRLAGMAGVVIVGCALFYAKSMGAWAGLAVAALVTVGLAVGGSLPRIARLTLALGCLAVLLMGATVVLTKLAPSISLAVRGATHRIGVEAVSERPFLGFGANGYTRQSLRLERKVFGLELTEFHRPGEPISAHSSFLNVAVERGVLGVAAFVAILATVFGAGIRGYFRAPDLARRAVLLGLIAGLTAFGVQAFTENLFNYSKVATVFWILAAAVVSLGASSRPNARGDGETGDRAMLSYARPVAHLGERGRAG